MLNLSRTSGVSDTALGVARILEAHESATKERANQLSMYVSEQKALRQKCTYKKSKRLWQSKKHRTEHCEVMKQHRDAHMDKLQSELPRLEETAAFVKKQGQERRVARRNPKKRVPEATGGLLQEKVGVGTFQVLNVLCDSVVSLHFTHEVLLVICGDVCRVASGRFITRLIAMVI